MSYTSVKVSLQLEISVQTIMSEHRRNIIVDFRRRKAHLVMVEREGI